MGDLNDIFKTDGVSDVMAADINNVMVSAIRGGWYRANTMSANLTLTDADYPIQILAGASATKTVTLPAEGNSNHAFWFLNISGYAMTVKDDSGTQTIVVLTNNQAEAVVPFGGSVWVLANNSAKLPPTVTDTTTPGAAPTSLTNFLDMLANIVKTMTNAANWYSAAVRVLVRSNNLSDLADAPTARTNLAVGTTDVVTFGGVISSGIISTSVVVTVTGSTHTVAATTSTILCNYAGTVTLTLPDATTYAGRWLFVKTITANTVISNASNVRPINSNTLGTAILAATAGKWAALQASGGYWIVMMTG